MASVTGGIVMAEVTARKRGSKWEYRFEMASVEGKRKQYSKSGFRTKKEALQAGAEAYAKYNRAGTVFEPSEISLADYLDYWFKQYVTTQLSHGSQVTYMNAIRTQLKPRFGSYKLMALTPAVLTEWLVDLAKNGYTENTISSFRNVFSSALTYAVEPLHFLQDTPFRFVKNPKAKKSAEPDPMSIDEFSRLMEFLPENSRYRLPFLISWNLGTRVGETTGLLWDDIGLDNMTVRIGHQILYYAPVSRKLDNKKRPAQSALYICPPKTKSSYRFESFGEILRELLIQEKQRQEENERLYGDYYTVQVGIPETDSNGTEIIHVIQKLKKDLKPEDRRVYPVCLDENGKITVCASVKHACSRFSKKLGFHIHFHQMRHSHATNLIENGVDIVTVQHRLGHKNFSTTYSIYVHNTTAMAQKGVDVQEEINKALSTSMKSVDNTWADADKTSLKAGNEKS